MGNILAILAVLFLSACGMISPRPTQPQHLVVRDTVYDCVPDRTQPSGERCVVSGVRETASPMPQTGQYVAPASTQESSIAGRIRGALNGDICAKYADDPRRYAKCDGPRQERLDAEAAATGAGLDQPITMSGRVRIGGTSVGGSYTSPGGGYVYPAYPYGYAPQVVVPQVAPGLSIGAHIVNSGAGFGAANVHNATIAAGAVTRNIPRLQFPATPLSPAEQRLADRPGRCVSGWSTCGR